jgi:hypothetical protein
VAAGQDPNMVHTFAAGHIKPASSVADRASQAIVSVNRFDESNVYPHIRLLVELPTRLEWLQLPRHSTATTGLSTSERAEQLFLRN